MNYNSCKKLLLYSIFLILCIYAANNTTPTFSLSENKFNLVNLEGEYQFENVERSSDLEREDGVRERTRGARRLLLGGPGSSPPRCAKKCGGCMPCRAVHEPVPPGRRVTTEYYPEAWRCKCGNKSYMP